MIRNAMDVHQDQRSLALKAEMSSLKQDGLGEPGCLHPRARWFTLEDGATSRDEPEALKSSQVDLFFYEKACRFGLSLDVQEELLPIEANWFREERKLTASLPLMQTTYRIHKVRIRVSPDRQELEGLGLPSMSEP